MFMAVLTLATATAFHAKTPPMDTPLFLPNTYLVEARVVDVDKKTSAAHLVIKRIYAGDNATERSKIHHLRPYFWAWDNPWPPFVHSAGQRRSGPLVGRLRTFFDQPKCSAAPKRL